MILSTDTALKLIVYAKVLHEMLPFHQEWAGVKLVPNNAYGLRIYRSQAKLLMHTDSPETHVISSILHVDHDDDPSSEPWPLVIEDFVSFSFKIYYNLLYPFTNISLFSQPNRTETSTKSSSNLV